ncbi:MAG: hypothetical protein ACE5EH_09405 [Gammaproteobacteria bacterium]
MQTSTSIVPIRNNITVIHNDRDRSHVDQGAPRYEDQGEQTPPVERVIEGELLNHGGKTGSERQPNDYAHFYRNVVLNQSLNSSLQLAMRHVVNAYASHTSLDGGRNGQMTHSIDIYV